MSAARRRRWRPGRTAGTILFLGVFVAVALAIARSDGDGGATPSPIDGALPCQGFASDHPACPDPRLVEALDAVWSERSAPWDAPRTVVAVPTASGACARVGPAAGWYCRPVGAIVVHPDHHRLVERHVREHGGEHARAYLLAREHGHHLQGLQGKLDPADGTGTDPAERARIELRADCLAGVGLHHAVAAGRIDPLEPDALEAAVRTAGAVDERLRAEHPPSIDALPPEPVTTDERVVAARFGWDAGDEAACEELEPGALAPTATGTVLPPPTTIGPLR